MTTASTTPDIIGVDLDGVVVRTYGRFASYANKKFGTKTHPRLFTNYDLSVGTGVSREQMIEIFAANDFYKFLPAMPLAVESLRRLYDAGFMQHIITVRPNTDAVRTQTLKWLADKNVPFDAIHIVSKHADYGAGADAKGEIARRLGIRYAVEDSPINARAYAKVCETVFLVNATYNVNESMPGNVVRINDLSEMAHFLLKTMPF